MREAHTMIVIKHPITDRLINRLLLKSNERKLKIEEEDNPRGLTRFLPLPLALPLL